MVQQKTHTKDEIKNGWAQEQNGEDIRKNHLTSNRNYPI